MVLNDGGSVFPTNGEEVNFGLMVRDLIALTAMHACIVNMSARTEYDPQRFALAAYEYADAMIKAREGKG